jgi:hypothetical protein
MLLEMVTPTPYYDEEEEANNPKSLATWLESGWKQAATGNFWRNVDGSRVVVHRQRDGWTASLYHARPAQPYHSLSFATVLEAQTEAWAVMTREPDNDNYPICIECGGQNISVSVDHDYAQTVGCDDCGSDKLHGRFPECARCGDQIYERDESFCDYCSYMMNKDD